MLELKKEDNVTLVSLLNPMTLGLMASSAVELGAKGTIIGVKKDVSGLTLTMYSVAWLNGTTRWYHQQNLALRDDNVAPVEVALVDPTETKFNVMVSALAKSGKDILAEMTANRMELLHMVVGISGEAGELLDALKKHTIYNKPLDLVNVIEELGDIEFYMQGLREYLGITREQTLEANIKKLGKRYATGSYSNAQAQERADKAEGEI